MLVMGVEHEAALIVEMYKPLSDRRLDEAYERFKKLFDEWNNLLLTFYRPP